MCRIPNSLRTVVGVSLLVLGCEEGPSNPVVLVPPDVDRIASIPPDVEKVTPARDRHPPILHSDEFEEPVPLPVISTAGGEDAPFIPSHRPELYFFFAADIREDPSVQVQDPVNGIWVSRQVGGTWQEPELVWLQGYQDRALNGCPWVGGNEMLFCTVRKGFTGVHWFRAEYLNGKWDNWELQVFHPDLEMGELHIHRDTLYYGSPRPGGSGGQDIWMATLSGADWANPANVASVNTDADETRPYVSPDGLELWFTRWYEGSPAIVRSRKVDGVWQEGELIVSQFAGEPTLDADGNLYFAHHFYDDGVMLEADIYVAYRR